jgi:hypothetical protein
MALFPDIVGAARRPVPFFHVTRSEMGENHVTRYRKFIRPRVMWDLGWDLLTPTQADLINAHVLAHAGAHLTFDWFDWRPFHWLWVPIGFGDGVEDTFDLPGKVCSDVEFFKNASTAITGTVTEGAGANGRARVVFDATPADGDVLWMNATMKRLFTVRFDDDRQPLAQVRDTGHYGFATRLVEAK